MLSGENSNPLGGPLRPSGPAGSMSGLNSGAPAAPAVANSILLAARVLSSTSHLSRLEIDAWIDPGVGQIGNQIHDEADECKNVKVREDDWIVAIKDAFKAQQPKTVEREDGLDKQGAGKKGADEGAGKAGDDQKHGVAENMPVEHLALGAAL